MEKKIEGAALGCVALLGLAVVAFYAFVWFQLFQSAWHDRLTWVIFWAVVVLAGAIGLGFRTKGNGS